ncbi:MAG TPA: prolyl oligopeptidase family serine peptidase, partial [Vicinamibacteria bacterium]|nr:prolyl oligopeptidase family serine peptidase [Vicinamibacteria bacterium]
DRGADENWSIYRVPLDGGAPVELTPGEKMQRDNALVAERAPERVFFSGRRMSDASSAVFSVPQAGGATREVFRDPKPFTLAGVRRDGKEVLVVRFPTRSDNQVLLVDAESGAARRIFPAEGGAQAAVYAAAYAPDGGTVYVASDLGGERSVVLALDAASGAEKARYIEPGRPVGFPTLLADRTGKRLVLEVDRGNESAVYVLDANTLAREHQAQLPSGGGTLTGLSWDGNLALVTWSTPATPADVWAVDLASGAARPLRQETRPTLASIPAMDARVVSVSAEDGLPLPVNVILPRGATGRLPVIVSYHGGPSASSRLGWSPVRAFFVSLGYAWVEPNVRGSGGFGRAYEEADNGHRRLDAFRDIETTGRWAAAQPWADPARVVVFGGSYGGYTVLVALTRMPTLWRAGVDLFGVANLKSFMATTAGLIRETFLLEFGDPDTDGEFLDSISPLRDADKIVDPLFVYAGANDPRVPRSESDLIVKALRSRRVPVEYMVAPNEGHSLSRRENLTQFLTRAARFLERYASGQKAPSS